MDNENEEEKQDELQDELQEILQKMPKKMRVMEQGIDAATLAAFEQMRQELVEADALEITELPNLTAVLELADDPLLLKPLVVRIAETGSVQAFRMLEQLEVLFEQKITQTWLRMGILHCRMRLENELLDEPVGFIATGLGGKGDSIRYYFALRSKEGELQEGQGRWAEQEYLAIAKSFKGEIEYCEIYSRYVAFMLLLPWQASVVDLVGQGLEQCDFLDATFWITNVGKPTPEEITTWLEHKTPPDVEQIDEMA